MGKCGNKRLVEVPNLAAAPDKSRCTAAGGRNFKTVVSSKLTFSLVSRKRKSFSRTFDKLLSHIFCLFDMSDKHMFTMSMNYFSVAQ